jgi:sodium-dependent dicarboxylate transporter 2/3/5
VAHAAIAGLVGSGAVTWEHIERTTHWSVLLLFGGGLALGQVMDSTGASRMLAQGLGWRMQPHAAACSRMQNIESVPTRWRRPG